MDSLPPKPKAEFVPEQISMKGTRRGRGRGDRAGNAGAVVSIENATNSGGASQRLHGHQPSQPSQPSAISSSVVFHDDGGSHPLAGVGQRLDSYPTSRSADATSAKIREDCELFDEIDELFPHDYEGGNIASDPNSSVLTLSSGSLSNSKSITSSLLQSLRYSSSVNGDGRVPTDYESLVASSNDGTLAQLIAGIEDRYRASTTSSVASMQNKTGNEETTDGGSKLTRENVGSKRESIVGGSPAPSPPSDGCNVDWSSLSKSCKRAKSAFRDADSGQLVVRNMFLTHLGALIAVLERYLERYCGSNDPGDGGISWADFKARTTETKRALRFAMTCLVPPRAEEDPKSTRDAAGGEAKGQESIPAKGSSELKDDVEDYRFERKYRHELQEAAVKGLTPRSSSPTPNGEVDLRREPRHYGLQLPLVEIILAEKMFTENDAHLPSNQDKENDAAIIFMIENDKRTVRILAARLLCNLVTDNPLAAEIILRDVPFSPTPDQVDGRMAGLILGPGKIGNNTAAANEDEAIFWCDLLDATAKVRGVGASKNNGNGKQQNSDGSSEDREALAAVAAALHNLLTSLEARESLLELDDEMKRRENAKQHQKQASRSQDCHTEHFDAGFEVASNGPLMNALLRNILPAKAVLMQSKYEKELTTASRPKFKPSSSLLDTDNMSDSATEWISLVLERLASRGLLPQMFQTAGGSSTGSITPEQVVLASCIRQAVDDYHSSLTPAGDAGGFGRRRLSIAAKTSGMTVTTRPHPLWGRAASQGRYSRTAVPVLLSLANEVEEVRQRANALRECRSNEAYDGERNCSIRIIDDICDILAQSLGRHASSAVDAADNKRNKLCFIADSRSVLGRETSLIASCCKDLARILDTSLARNSGRKARELELSPQDQQTAIVMVRLIANLIYKCRYNQDLLRITPVPMTETADNDTLASSYRAGVGANTEAGLSTERAGLHIILSATSLAPACFTLREWCIVAIRNAVESNAANAETVRRLEANQVLGDTPELQRMGVKVEMDKKGNVIVK